jgi:hypothetical protein
MNSVTKILAATVAAIALATGVFAQSAKDVRGATPFIPVGT